MFIILCDSHAGLMQRHAAFLCEQYAELYCMAMNNDLGSVGYYYYYEVR